MKLAVTVLRVVLGVSISGAVDTVWEASGQNANITATVTQCCTITLTCHYIGAGNETFISWRNGSSVDILTLRPGSHIPDCEVFTVVNASYDPLRTSHSCDATSNIYTLKIDPVGTEDDNVTWYCTFQDPLLPDQWANVTIHLTGDNDSMDDDGTSVHLVHIGMVALGIIVIIILANVIFIIKKKTYRCNGQGGIRNTVVGMLCHKQPDPEEAINKQQLENLMNSVKE